MSLKYDAFISYRHAPLDMEMAKKVHTALETYHIPRSVRVKTGKNKMGRVFRDQEELPIGSDLDDNISTALESSNYLLVICSPRTPDSYWVCKEIESFIAMHGREHILAVLIEGEPDESFPKLLLTDDEGNPVEPLAADIRGETPKERNAKFKTEKLRLAAPIIGCTYDDLKQRHRERMIRRTVTIVSSIAAVIAIAGTAFGIYSSNVAAKMKQLADEKSQLADEKTQLAEEILAEYKQKQENQSRFYAEESLSLLRSGNREDAVLVARTALPSPEDDRPYVPEAEYALAEALYAYDSGMDLEFDRILRHDMAISDIARSSNKQYLLVTDSGNKVYVYDSADWSLKTSIEPEIKDGGYSVNTEVVDADDTGVYVATEYSFRKYDYEGNLLYDNTVLSAINGGVIDAEANMAVLVGLDEVAFVNTDSGATVSTYVNEDEMNFSSHRCIYDAERKIAAVGHFASDAEHAYVSIISPESGRTAKGTSTEGVILDMYQTESGNIAMISVNSDYVSKASVTRMCLDLISPEGNLLWSTDIDASIRNWTTFDVLVKAHDYDTADGHRSEIDVAVEDEFFTYDESDGHRINYMTLRDDVTAMAVAVGGPATYISYVCGDVDIYNGNRGEMYAGMLIDTDLEQMNTIYLNSQAVIRSFMSSDLHVMAYKEAPDLIELEEHEDTQVLLGTAPDASYYVLSPLGDHTTIDFYDADGKHLYTYNGLAEYDLDAGFADNIFRFISHDGIISMDPVAGSAEERSWSSIGINEYISDAVISRSGEYAALWGSRVLYAVDMCKQEVVWSAETENLISNAFISDDGSRMIVYESGRPVYSIDTDDNEIHELDERLQPHGEMSLHEFLTVSRDGKTLAMFCMDGMARVADAESGEVICEVPATSRIRSFICFTPDDKYLMVQGDDAKLRICDASTGDTVALIELEDTVTDVIYDEDDSNIAVSIDEAVYLLDAQTYGRKTRVEEAVTYLKGNNRFLIRHNGVQMFMTTYKDYKTLLAEANAQFPDSVLDDERRVKYNIE